MAEVPELIQLGESVTIRALLIQLAQILGWAIAVGLIAIITYLVKALLALLAQTIGRANFSFLGLHIDLGKWIVGNVADLAQGLSNELGNAAGALDQSAGQFWYGLRHLVGSVGEEIMGLAVLGGYLAWYVAKHYNPAAILQRIAHAEKTHAVTQTITNTITRTVTRVEKVVTHATTGQIGAAIRAAVKPIEGKLAEVERLTLPRVKALEHEVEDVLNPEVAKLRDRAKAVEDGAIRAYERVKGLWEVASIGAVAAVAVVALSRLGLGWLRCRNVGQAGRALCGLPGALLNDLLGLLADYAILSTICDIVPLLEEAYSTIAAPLAEGIAITASTSCAGPDRQPPKLTGPSPILPAVQFSGTLILP